MSPARRCQPGERDLKIPPPFSEAIQAAKIPCIFVCETGGMAQPFLDLAEKSGVPVVASAHDAFLLESRLKGLLREKLAQCSRVHGVLLQICGLGVLIQGDSGVGKTTAGVMLVRRGHTWIADDVVEITKKRGGRLYAGGAGAASHLIDLKNSGIASAGDLFGCHRTAEKTELHLILEMHLGSEVPGGWRPDNDLVSREIMGTPIPCIRILRTKGRAFDAGDIERRVREFGRRGDLT